MEKITPAMLTDMGICPTCWNRENGYRLFGDETAQTVYENEHFKCVLISEPRAPGHAVIVSQAHYKDMMDIPDDLCRDVYSFARRAMVAIRDVYGSESVYLCTMCDGPMNHFHVQLIPRYADEKRGSKNFVKPRREYIHDAGKIAALRALLQENHS